MAALVAVGVLAAAVLGAVAGWLAARSAPGRPLTVTRSLVDVHPAEELNGGGAYPGSFRTPGGSRTVFAWTPDGQALVFVGLRGGVQQLYVRRLNAAEARPIKGTEGGQVPAVSPEGRWLAFWSNGAIRKVQLQGDGLAMVIAPDISVPPVGLVWDGRGGLFFGYPDDGRIWAVPPDGPPHPVTTLGKAEARPHAAVSPSGRPHPPIHGAKALVLLGR